MRSPKIVGWGYIVLAILFLYFIFLGPEGTGAVGALTILKEPMLFPLALPLLVMFLYRAKKLLSKENEISSVSSKVPRVAKTSMLVFIGLFPLAGIILGLIAMANDNGFGALFGMVLAGVSFVILVIYILLFVIHRGNDREEATMSNEPLIDANTPVLQKSPKEVSKFEVVVFGLLSLLFVSFVISIISDHFEQKQMKNQSDVRAERSEAFVQMVDTIPLNAKKDEIIKICSDFKTNGPGARDAGGNMILDCSAEYQDKNSLLADVPYLPDPAVFERDQNGMTYDYYRSITPIVATHISRIFDLAEQSCSGNVQILTLLGRGGFIGEASILLIDGSAVAISSGRAVLPRYDEKLISSVPNGTAAVCGQNFSQLSLSPIISFGWKGEMVRFARLDVIHFSNQAEYFDMFKSEYADLETYFSKQKSMK
ncbi:MAG TPA: hypothetical protein VJ579_01445 [Candidatus Paceibacterota bacterium]|nr:hypothetical protein [Candidatus Paceibacterota bacterium]